ncbi:MAG: hypothetical protein P8179_15270 [Candidatus Thiodiazotropha sp.]|jgi:TPR repeat protein
MTSSYPRLHSDFSEKEETGDNSGRLRVALEITVAALILTGIYFTFAPEEQIELQKPLLDSQIDPIIRAHLDEAKQAAKLQADTEVTVTTPKTENSPQTNRANSKTSNTAIASATPVAQDGEDARTLIKRLRSGKLKLTAAEILEQADQYSRNNSLSDAYLLLFYAARGGNGQAAFALASMYDPNHFVTGNTLLEKPDIYQAYKWYQAAAERKVTDANERLIILRRDIEKQAKAGDPTASRLLLNWR